MKRERGFEQETLASIMHRMPPEGGVVMEGGTVEANGVMQDWCVVAIRGPKAKTIATAIRKLLDQRTELDAVLWEEELKQ